MQRLFFRWVAHAVDSHGRSAVCHNSVSPLIAALRLSYVSTGWRTTAAAEQTTSGIAFEFWSLCDHFAGLNPEKVVEIKTMFTTKLIKAKKKGALEPWLAYRHFKERLNHFSEAAWIPYLYDHLCVSSISKCACVYLRLHFSFDSALLSPPK